jgi:hypothetical protein
MAKYSPKDNNDIFLAKPFFILKTQSTVSLPEQEMVRDAGSESRR